MKWGISLSRTLPAVVPPGMCAWPECAVAAVEPRSRWCRPSRFCRDHRYDGPRLGRKSIYWKTRHLVFSRDNWKCHLCRRRIDPRGRGLWTPSLDHDIPVWRGGTSDLGNLRASHLRCNLSKGPGQ